MRKIAFAIASIFVTLTYQDAHAQGFWYLPPGGDFSYRYGIDLGNGFGYGYGFGIGYGSVASPESTTASAYADLSRLQGQFSVMPSKAYEVGKTPAPAQLQQVTAKSVDQYSLPTLQTVNAGQTNAVVQSLQQQVNHPKPTQDRHVSPIEFDRATGKVMWPAGLSGEACSVHRSEMEVLLKSVAKTGITPGLKARIDDKTQEIHDAIRRQHRALSSKEYSEGHRFINRLASEAQMPSS